MIWPNFSRESRSTVSESIKGLVDHILRLGLDESRARPLRLPLGNPLRSQESVNSFTDSSSPQVFRPFCHGVPVSKCASC